MKPPTPDAELPPDRLRHHNPDGEVVWITSSATVEPDANITIEPGAQLGVNVMLSGDTTIAEKAEVGNSVEVINSTLKEGARVGDSSTVINSTVGERSHIGQGNDVRDAEIGYDVVSGVGEEITGVIEDEAVIETKIAV
ncbi:hypothetical protein HY004_02860 [Candidatus Saccharibacteria bacterium]|nr:hypothetical protein [Candidatus Saccharibacteria bacterium]